MTILQMFTLHASSRLITTRLLNETEFKDLIYNHEPVIPKGLVAICRARDVTLWFLDRQWEEKDMESNYYRCFNDIYACALTAYEEVWFFFLRNLLLLVGTFLIHMFSHVG